MYFQPLRHLPTFVPERQKMSWILSDESHITIINLPIRTANRKITEVVKTWQASSERYICNNSPKAKFERLEENQWPKKNPNIFTKVNRVNKITWLRWLSSRSFFLQGKSRTQRFVLSARQSSLYWTRMRKQHKPVLLSSEAMSQCVGHQKHNEKAVVCDRKLQNLYSETQQSGGRQMQCQPCLFCRHWSIAIYADELQAGCIFPVVNFPRMQRPQNHYLSISGHTQWRPEANLTIND